MDRSFGSSLPRSALLCGFASRFVINSNCACSFGGCSPRGHLEGARSIHFSFRVTNGLLCKLSHLANTSGSSRKHCGLFKVGCTRFIGKSVSFDGDVILSGHGGLTFRVNVKINCPCNGSGVLPFRHDCFSKNTGDIHN